MTQTVRKLPLWQGLLDELTEEGISHGKSYEASRFEESLSCKRDSREFGLAVHEIRLELERRGFYLQGHAIRDGKLVIVPPEKHIGVVRGFERRNQKNRRRSISLLSSTDRSLLPAKLRPYHEKMLMRIEIKQMLERRAGSIHRFISKRAPKLLEARG
jgi:hypothetical protein